MYSSPSAERFEGDAHAGGAVERAIDIPHAAGADELLEHEALRDQLADLHAPASVSPWRA